MSWVTHHPVRHTHRPPRVRGALWRGSGGVGTPAPAVPRLLAGLPASCAGHSGSAPSPCPRSPDVPRPALDRGCVGAQRSGQFAVLVVRYGRRTERPASSSGPPPPHLVVRLLPDLVVGSWGVHASVAAPDRGQGCRTPRSERVRRPLAGSIADPDGHHPVETAGDRLVGLRRLSEPLVREQRTSPDFAPDAPTSSARRPPRPRQPDPVFVPAETWRSNRPGRPERRPGRGALRRVMRRERRVRLLHPSSGHVHRRPTSPVWPP
jgi:hypothetical protein